MKSRDRILQKLKEARRDINPSHDTPLPLTQYEDPVGQFKRVVSVIGGIAIEIGNIEEVVAYVSKEFPHAGEVVTTLFPAQTINEHGDPHSLSNASVAILKGELGVAENGAVWVNETNMIDRVLPFICENLMLVINKQNILNNMHEAYDKIGSENYQYGTFISGPSKTADIEQSLVLGAHGAKSLVVFIQGDVL